MTLQVKRVPIAARRDARRGFTLLEMVLVMFIISLLITAVFGIVNSVTQLTNDMSVEQQRDARLHGFIELCTRTLRNLPPSAVVRLRNQQVDGRLVSQFTLAGATSPVSGDAGGVIVLETEQATDGYLRVAMRAMSASQAAAWEKGDMQVGLRVPLLENVTTMEWRFYDSRSGEWTSLWNDKLPLFASGGPAVSDATRPTSSNAEATRPGIVELRMTVGAGSPQRHVFWVPAAQPLRPSAPIRKPDDAVPSPKK